MGARPSFPNRHDTKCIEGAIFFKSRLFVVDFTNSDSHANGATCFSSLNTVTIVTYPALRRDDEYVGLAGVLSRTHVANPIRP